VGTGLEWGSNSEAWPGPCFAGSVAHSPHPPLLLLCVCLCIIVLLGLWRSKGFWFLLVSFLMKHFGYIGMAKGIVLMSTWDQNLSMPDIWPLSGLNAVYGILSFLLIARGLEIIDTFARHPSARLLLHWPWVSFLWGFLRVPPFSCPCSSSFHEILHALT
jgi:hypothetical protein